MWCDWSFHLYHHIIIITIIITIVITIVIIFYAFWVFQIIFNWWSFTGDWMTASLFRPPGLSWLFLLILRLLSSGLWRFIYFPLTPVSFLGLSEPFQVQELQWLSPSLLNSIFNPLAKSRYLFIYSLFSFFFFFFFFPFLLYNLIERQNLLDGIFFSCCWLTQCLVFWAEIGNPLLLLLLEFLTSA